MFWNRSYTESQSLTVGPTPATLARVFTLYTALRREIGSSRAPVAHREGQQ